jgi:hypothetical protein
MARPKTGAPRRIRFVTTLSVDTIAEIVAEAERRQESRGAVIDRRFKKKNKQEN